MSINHTSISGQDAESSLTDALSLGQLFDARFWLLALGCTLASALVIGIPTVLVPNSFFVRMLPSSPRDYVFLALSVLLLGPLFALALLNPTASILETLHQIGSGNMRAFVGGVLTFLSVGCPICNKVIVLLLGVSGAITIFDPLRPFLGVASLLLLGTTLFLRIRTLMRGCPLPAISPIATTDVVRE